MSETTLDIVIIPQDDDGQSLISFLDIEEKGLRWDEQFQK